MPFEYQGGCTGQCYDKQYSADGRRTSGGAGDWEWDN